MIGRIYMLICNVTGLQYIGSTTDTLKRRLQYHEKDFKRFEKGLCSNVTSFDIIKNGNYYIELIEEVEIDTKQELYDIENIYIENIECVNRIKAPLGLPALVSMKIYRDKNRDVLNEKKRQKYKTTDYYKLRYQENKEDISKKAKEKYICECGIEISNGSKYRHEKSATHKKNLFKNNSL